MRFLDPESGRVTLAGRDLRELRQEDVRAAVAVAGQDSHLFSTSIRENVRLGRPGASDDEVDAALERARIRDWVDGLPDGADTLVGEEGRELSGGQRQRLVEDVLDAAGGRTVLLNTHRPEGLERMDDVVTLARGAQESLPATSKPMPTG